MRDDALSALSGFDEWWDANVNKHTLALTQQTNEPSPHSNLKLRPQDALKLSFNATTHHRAPPPHQPRLIVIGGAGADPEYASAVAAQTMPPRVASQPVPDWAAELPPEPRAAPAAELPSDRPRTPPRSPAPEMASALSPHASREPSCAGSPARPVPRRSPPHAVRRHFSPQPSSRRPSVDRQPAPTRPAAAGRGRPAFDASPTAGNFLFDPSVHSRANSLRAVEARRKRRARRVATVLTHQLQNLGATLKTKILPGSLSTPQQAAFSLRQRHLREEALTLSRSADGGVGLPRGPSQLLNETRMLLHDALEPHEERAALEDLDLELYYVSMEDKPPSAAPSPSAAEPVVAGSPHSIGSASRAARELLAALPLDSVGSRGFGVAQAAASLPRSGELPLTPTRGRAPAAYDGGGASSAPPPTWSHGSPAHRNAPSEVSWKQPLSRSDPSFSVAGRQASALAVVDGKGAAERVTHLERRLDEQARELRAQTDILKDLAASLQGKSGPGASGPVRPPSSAATPSKQPASDAGRAPPGKRGAVVEALTTLRQMDEEHDRLYRKWIEGSDEVESSFPIVGPACEDIKRGGTSARSSIASLTFDEEPPLDIVKGARTIDLPPMLETAIWRARDRFEEKLAEGGVAEPWKLVDALTEDLLGEVVDASTADVWEASGQLVDEIYADEFRVVGE